MLYAPHAAPRCVAVKPDDHLDQIQLNAEGVGAEWNQSHLDPAEWREKGTSQLEQEQEQEQS